RSAAAAAARDRARRRRGRARGGRIRRRGACRARRERRAERAGSAGGAARAAAGGRSGWVPRPLGGVLGGTHGRLVLVLAEWRGDVGLPDQRWIGPAVDRLAAVVLGHRLRAAVGEADPDGNRHRRRRAAGGGRAEEPPGDL